MRRRVMGLVVAIAIVACMSAVAGGQKEGASAAAASAKPGTEFRTEDYVYFSPAAYQKKTGQSVGSFKEAPMLAKLVAEGKLPAVADRLPAEPIVLKPVEKIGTYTDKITVHNVDEMYMRMASVLKNTNRVTEALPWFADYTMSADGKTITLKIKKGVRWSDGEPFTADDIMFWWQDILNNKDLTPTFPSDWTRGGQPAKMAKIDDLTIQITYSVPFTVIPIYLGGPFTNQGSFYTPMHYVKKWHIKYNPDANKLAKEEKYDTWVQAFQAHNSAASYGATEKSIGLPVLGPWRIVEVTPTYTVAERNPYYPVVDTAGNQLPYIDRVVALVLNDHESLMLKAYAGELDHLYIYIQTQDYPVLKENEQKGNYRVSVAAQQPFGSEAWWTFNQNIKDPEKRAIFQDVRFRRAMSVAIDREAINKLLYFGKGVPWQITIDPNTSFFKKEWTTNWAQYDPALANKLLDEMGLTKRDGEGFRMTSSGKQLTVLMQGNQDERHMATAEPVAKYWRAVGINAQVRPVEGNYMSQLVDTSTYESRGWGTTLPEAIGYLWGLGHFPNAGIEQWRSWWTSGGKTGEEPPQAYKDWYTKMDKWFASAKGTPEYAQLGQQVMDFFSDQVLEIGTVGNAPSPAINKTYLKNVNMDGIMTNWFAEFQANLLPEQWFIQK